MVHNGAGSPDLPITRPRRPERALAVAALGAVLFLQPVLGLFDLGGTTTVAGVPALFIYLFAAWTLIVALTALVMETRRDDAQSDTENQSALMPSDNGVAQSDGAEAD